MTAAETAKRPRGLTKWLMAAPKWLFKMRLGFVFGKRFVLLEHQGRRSEKRYETPLEVVSIDIETGEIVVLSARGDRADWFRNLQASPALALWIGNTRRQVDQRFLSAGEGLAALTSYQAAHPKAARRIAAALSLPDPSSPEARAALAAVLPMVGLTPHSED